MFLLLLSISQSSSCEFFQCQDKSRLIPSSFLNDNFCDCPDGSDEPKTSACPSNTFQCPGRSIPSSQVQDGVCDCCDGSDEISIKCPNNCQDFLKKQKQKNIQEFETIKSGIKENLESKIRNKERFKHETEHMTRFKTMQKEADEKIAFIEALIKVANGTLDNLPIEQELVLAKDVRKDLQEEMKKVEKMKRLDFGKDLEFFDLFGKSMKVKIEKYEYNILFFDQAMQKEGKKVVSLGQWANFNKDYTEMRFTGGTLCHNNQKRALTLFIKCSVQVTMTSLKEVSMCKYEGILTHPGVCNTI